MSCRVLQLSRQPYYRWLASPVTNAKLAAAYRANALFDAHREDPEFGYRFLAGEAATVGELMAERTAWRICRDNAWPDSCHFSAPLTLGVWRRCRRRRPRAVFRP